MKWMILTGFLVLLGHGEGYSDEGDSSSQIKSESLPKPVRLFRVDEGKGIKRIQPKSHAHKRAVCKPNQVFENECNSCKCSSDGQTYSCTQAECLERDMTKEVEVFMESEGVDHIERHSVCKPQDTFYIGCNTCRCNGDGTDFSCTNKPCPLPDDVELFHELTPAQASNRTCIAKAMFVKECNICWCNDDGTDFFCTRKVCVPEPEDLPETPEEFRVIKKECRPFEVFELDCNMCRCNADGKSFSCTRRACLDLEDKVDGPAEVKFPLRRSIRAAPQDKPKACEPGEEFRMDCNKCLCDNEGFSFSCTRNDCAQASASVRARREVAGEGEVKKVEGGCEPGSSSPAGCPPHDKKILENGFRCNPGEQFKQDCNDCTCSADGRSTFCTVRLCDNALPQSIAP